MHLTPREQERLTIFTLAELARRRQQRGRLLNAPEATAVICDVMLESAWDGNTLQQVIDDGQWVLREADVMPGVTALIGPLQVEVLMPSGTALIALDPPILPEPGRDPEDLPGAVRTAAGDIELNVGRRRDSVQITNVGQQHVFVSSHFPLAQVNAGLEFDRQRAAGMRMDLPAGYSQEFAPGESLLVGLVSLQPGSEPAPESEGAPAPEPGSDGAGAARDRA